jgi:hypothetical protein
MCHHCGVLPMADVYLRKKREEEEETPRRRGAGG